jgi:thiol-disulfide isomerase/thioredoxin
MAKALDGSTVVLDGKLLKKHDILASKAPEYYMLYWGASWCGPCRQAAPHLAEAYDETISKGKNIDVVHLSCDQDEDGMVSFKWSKEKIFKPMAPKGIPNYKLVDAEGKIIAEGEEAKSKAKELAGKGTTEESPGALSK